MSTTARTLMLCTAVLLAALCCGVGAQGPASAPALGPALEPSFGPASAPPAETDCNDALLNMSACLTFVEAGSNETVPDKGCCPGLKGLVDSQPQCLCQLLANADIYGIKIDTIRALTLPTACRVQTPPVSLCAVLGIPVPSPLGPALSPASDSSEAPGTPIPSSPLMGSVTPTSSPPSSGSRTTATNLLLFLAFVSVIAIF